MDVGHVNDSEEMQARRPTQRRRFLIGSLLGLLATGALLWWWTRPYTPEEIVGGAVAVGTAIDVVGYVDPMSVVPTEHDSVRFELAANNGVLRVHLENGSQHFLSIVGKRVRVHGVLVDVAAMEAVQIELLDNER